LSSPYVYAALLLHSAKQPVTEENLNKVLSASGITVEEARVKSLVAALSEVNIEEAIKAAPVGFAAPAPAAATTPTPAPAAEKKKEDKKVEEKKKEEEALSGLGALFG